MDETSWQIELRLRDSDLEAFKAVMKRYRVGRCNGDIASHGYLWSMSDDGTGVVIAKKADRISAPTVTWSADWPTARQAFAQIGAEFASDLLAVAEPVNLVTFGDNEPDIVDDTVVDAAPVVHRRSRLRNPAKRRVVVHSQASLQLANG
ncbi:MAG: hypothetical protein AAF563_13680 [Pseudomonadota bacterium]